MNIEDCKKGMKLKCIAEKPKGARRFGASIKKGDILTVEAIRNDLHYDSGLVINFEEVGCIWWPEDFEPVNKFEIGESVIFNKKFIGEILDYDEKMGEAPYAVKIKTKNGYSLVKASEGQLSNTKKKDKLEVGDKFKDRIDSKVKVLFVAYDERFDKIKYFGKRLKDNYIGIWSEQEIEEIIYD